MIVRFPFVQTFANPDFLCTPLATVQGQANKSDATVQIAIWSNIEVGLGISAGSLATLRPLLRQFRGSSADREYLTNSYHRRTGSRLPGASHDCPVPLGSLDAEEGRLRPDKLAVTVTTVSTHHGNDTTWLGGPRDSDSDERSNGDGPLSPRSHGSGNWNMGGGEMGLNVHRTFEVQSDHGGWKY